MLYILCVSILVTVILMVITLFQRIQIYCMKKELKKCLKVIARCKPDSKTESAVSQIKKH
ncbi:MAG: hypothetical protein LBR79_04835 [Oscillospiraceae bacterium]|nr:hypothetical protein [Oscillospiraceae bacterium]